MGLNVDAVLCVSRSSISEQSRVSVVMSCPLCGAMSVVLPLDHNGREGRFGSFRCDGSIGGGAEPRPTTVLGKFSCRTREFPVNRLLI